ncbi:gliding motility-associated C-terminal domain-containing protein [Ferruginibacter lapsinanis]|uniref:PKD domain-containing protein n=1 Tax=Ferruginibacter lapsinanis TaxID=563172 RepID=UPI001E55C5B4|nr:PKD domain-containing protein [Ferruginibacter lapsinanis]UEG49543.1 gliding motility-associated C-terminal domain-containing protein [Ferruginibacter lapsinanis]
MIKLYPSLLSQLSIFFIFLFCGDTVNAQENSNELYTKAPNYTFFTDRGSIKTADKGFVEVESKRTIDSRYFIGVKDPSVFYIEKSLGALHYKQGDRWLPINDALSPIGGNIFEASDQLEPVGFDMSAKTAYIKTVYGIVHFNSWKLFGKKNGREVVLSAPDWSHYTAGDNGLYITNIFPGIDAELRVLKGAVKTSFIITKNYFSGYDALVFKDIFYGDNSSDELKRSNGGNEEADYFIDKKKILHIGSNVVYAAMAPDRSIKKIPYSIRANELSFAVDVAYIDQYILSGKVIIDPLVSAVTSIAANDIKASKNNGSFATACKYPVNVTVPANATFTNVSFQFTMYSKAPANTGMIFFAITNGSCYSGNWTCASTNDCTQQGTVGSLGNYTNISNSMLSCLPPPSCSEQTVSYMLHLWNRYTGAASICDTTYVGARDPFIIRMEGRTVEVGTISSSIPSLSVCAGTPVTLTATGLYGVSPYTFSWDNNAGNTAQVTIQPTITKAYTVTVTDRCNNTSTKPVTITITPGNTASPIVSNNGPFCENTSLSLQLSATVVSGATYKWTGPNGFTSTSRNPVISPVTLAKAGTYTVVATVGNCSSAPASTVVVVNPIPVISYASSDNPNCVGHTVHLSAADIPGAAYSWTGPNGFTSTERLPEIPNATLAASGQYTVTATVNNCTSVPYNNVHVEVYETPVITSASNNSPICAGETLSLTTPDITGASFIWYRDIPDDPWFVEEQNVTRTDIKVEDAAVYVVRAKLGYCLSAPYTTNVIINPSPVIGAVTVNGPLCKGQTINLSTANIAGATFKWTGPNGFTSTDQNPSIPNADIIHSGTYSVTATVNNCTSQSKTVLVTVTAMPVVSAVNNNGPVCEGQPILLTTPDITGASFTWTGVNGFASSQQNPAINTAAAINAGIYSVKATVNGCSSLPVTTNVTVKNTPIAGTVSNNSPLCNGQALSLTVPDIAGASFTWTGPNGFVSNDQHVSIPIVSEAIAGAYTVTATVNNCTSAPVTTVVFVGVAPVAGFSSSKACLPGTSVQFTNSSAISVGNIVSYQWDFGDPASGATNTSLSVSPQHTFSSANSFTVTLTVISDKGCPDTKTMIYGGFIRQPIANFSIDDAAVCVNDRVSFSNNSTTTDGDIQRSVWNFGTSAIEEQPDISTTLFKTFAAPGRYAVKLTVTNTGGCVDDTTQIVEVSPLPVINTEDNIVLFAGETRKLSITGERSDLAYSWSPATFLNSVIIAEPTISGITNDMVYKLVATSTGGCSATDSVSVKLLKPIEVPNTFTPNNDGINDLWLIENLQTYPNAKVEVFNRYGQLLYESKGIYKPWDGTYKGKPLPFGTYYYIIDTDGTVSTLTGYITIVK